MSKVLERLLRPGSEDKLLENFLSPREKVAVSLKKPGRPKVPKDKRARNFTLCLASGYLEFLDKMVVKDSKIKGRGRKIRFIIERFIEHEKRSLHHMKVLRESITQVEEVLKNLGPRVKKGEKLSLTPKEKASLEKATDQVYLLVNILHYSPKTLQKLLPKNHWDVLSFALNWKNHNKGIIL
jgi:hypothetical protein